MIVTAQASRECPNDVKKICEQLNIKHFYIELNGANQALLADPKTIKGLRNRVAKLVEMLQTQSEVAVIHCAAGIHRTGTLAYTLIRLIGENSPSKDEAFLALKGVREDTWKGVGEWRIDIAEKYLVQYLMAGQENLENIPQT